MNENNGTPFTMPVQPMYGNGGGYGNGFGFGGDWAWILLLLILGGNGWGMGGFGGGMMWPMMMGGAMGGFGMDYLYPWLNNSQHISDGFRDQQISTQISGLRSDVTGGFADTALGIAGINQSICQTGSSIANAMNAGFAGTTAAVNGAQNAIAQQLYANQIADMERSYSAQTANTAGQNALQAQLAQCCCENRAATADLKYTVATENCADRTAAEKNTRDIIDAQARGTQAILDKLCALELDGVKNQLAQAQRDNVGLQNQLNMANLAASQTAQNALIQQGFASEVDALYNRLNTCPVPTTPVYGRTPIFTCGGNSAGCGCGGVNTGFIG